MIVRRVDCATNAPAAAVSIPAHAFQNGYHIGQSTSTHLPGERSGSPGGIPTRW
jgi:hypothetical protein